MPAIRNSADLVNNFGEIRDIGLYCALQMGLDQINNGDVIEEDEMIGVLNNYIGNR